MTSTYIQDALRTKSPNFVLTPETIEGLIDAARGASAVGLFVNSLKKSIYYGKPLIEQDDTWLPDIAEPKTDQLDPDIVHGIIGLVTESCELLELVYTSMKTGEPIDKLKLIDEAGDQNWYLAILLSKLGVDFDAVQRANIAKLKSRYPDKFTEAQAEHRNKEAENAALAAAV